MYSIQRLNQSQFFLVFVAGLAAMAPLSVDAYLPILPDMADFFGSDLAAANITVSTFMFGMGVGTFLGGPLSDQIGRKTVGLLGLVIFIMSSLLIINATTIEQVQLLRITQALGSGFASVICMAQVRDIFEPADVAKKFANIIIVMLIAPMLAPTIGTIISSLGWRAIFWFLTIYGALMMFLYIALIPETNQQKAGSVNIAKLFSGYGTAISNKTDGRLIALRYALFSGLSSGILFSYVTNAAFLFIDYFSLSKFQFAAAFGWMGFMLMVGNRLSARSMDTFSLPTILDWANLMQVLVGAGLLFLCLLSEPEVWQIMVGLSLLIISNGAISPAASGYFISLYDKNIGSASSLSASIMFVSGALIGAIAALLSQGQILPLFAVMFACSISARCVLLSARERVS